MRINRKWLKKRQHSASLRLPQVIRRRYAKAIRAGNVPSDDQIRMAVKLGVVKETNGNLDPESLRAYFKQFISQRKADDLRH